jgi:Fe-S-cluster containining protein
MQKLFEIGTRNLDQVLARLDHLPEAEKVEMLPRCSTGCDYCCFQWVRCTVPEALAVYAKILETYSAEGQADVYEALKQYSLDFHSKPIGTRFSLGCPLLIDHRCSVYEARPLICRGTTSLDAEKCKLGKEDPAGDVLIPVIGPILNISWALRQGISQGLADQSLPSSELVLGLALWFFFKIQTHLQSISPVKMCFEAR